METTKIEFDEIALLRAFTSYGLDLEKKIDRLVGGLLDMVGDFGFESGSFNSQKLLYKPMGRSILYTNFIDDPSVDYPKLMMGVEEASLWLWIETPPNYSDKKIVTNSVLEVLPLLVERNSDWQATDEEWCDLGIEMPLQSLLATEDQEIAFRAFFRQALEDLHSVKLSEVISSAIKVTIEKA